MKACFFRILHGIGFNDTEIALQKSTIYYNLVSAMSKIVKAMRTFSIQFGDMEREVTIIFYISTIKTAFDFDWKLIKADATIVQESRKLSKEINFGLSLELTNSLKKLWRDKGVQKAYSRGNEYQLYDSTK